MKKIVSLIISVCILLSLVSALPITASAEKEGIFTYTVSNGEATITDCDTSASGDIVIPSTLGGYSVTYIGKSAFYNCESLTSITIPNNLTSIGDFAFWSCESLKSITIPDSVTSIGEGAFMYCKSLTSITIPDSVTSIGDVAFGYCEGLTSINVSTGNQYYTSVNGNLFNKDKTVLIQYAIGKVDETYSIPNDVTSIGEDAFSSCESLKSITIPDSVTSIGDVAFRYCESLTNINVSTGNQYYASVNGNLFNKDKTVLIQYAIGKVDETYSIPNDVTSIGEDAFSSCESLTSITIPDSVTSIGDFAFESCKSLTRITIPEGVTSIGAWVFSSCKSLTRITIPDSVTSIGAWAFSFCESLTRITIPDSVTNIGYSAFNGCSSLKDVYYSGSEDDWNKISIDFGNTPLTNATIHYNYTTDKVYSVKFNLNGGSGSCPEQQVSGGNYVVAPSKPTRSGYVFTGWYANSKCLGDPYITSTGIVKRKITANVTLYAGWKNTALIEWGKDSYSFDNYTPYFGDSYYIADSDLKKLYKNASAYNKLQIYSYRKNNLWDGSCFGMSMVAALNAMGKIDLNKFGADNLYELQAPKNNKKIESYINSYHFTQLLNSAIKEDLYDYIKGDMLLAKEIVSSLKSNKKVPIIVNYDMMYGGHTVFAYDVEDAGNKYKVYIFDPNYQITYDNSLPHAPVYPNDYFPRSEAQYMYISKDYETIEYDGWSTTNYTIDLTSVYPCRDFINEDLLGLMSDDSETQVGSFVDLRTNYDTFVIENANGDISNIDLGKIEGDISIAPMKSIDGLKQKMNCYAITEISDYIISPSDLELEKYSTSVGYTNGINDFLTSSSTVLPHSIKCSSEGTIETITDEVCKHNVSASINNASFPWYGVDIEFETANSVVSILEDGINIKSSTPIGKMNITVITDGTLVQEVYVTQATEIFITGKEENNIHSVLIQEENENISEFTINYSVSFLNTGNSIIESFYDVPYGSIVDMPESPTYEGFIFGGWYTDENYTTEWNFETDVVTDNLNLYAKWEEDPDYYRTITFVNADENIQVIVKDMETVSLKDYVDLFEDTGIRLQGWNTTGELDVEYKADATLSADSDITIYPVLKTLPYTESVVTKSNDLYNVETSIYNVSEACMILVAGYKNKELVSMKSVQYGQEYDPIVLTGDLDEIKVMLWDSESKLKPLCYAEVIQISEQVLQ